MIICLYLLDHYNLYAISQKFISLILLKFGSRETHNLKVLCTNNMGLLGPFKCYVMLWGVGLSTFPEKSVTKVYGSALLAL